MGARQSESVGAETGSGKFLRHAMHMKPGDQRYRFVGGIVASLLFGLACSLESRIVFEGISGTYRENYLSGLDAEAVLIFFAAGIIFFVAERLFLLGNSKDAASGEEPARFQISRILIVTLILLAAWLPYMLALYPGVVLPDTLMSISQILGNTPLTNHHPVIFTLTLGVFFKLFGTNPNHAVFAFALFQSTVLAGALSYSVEWVRVRGARRWMWIVAILFYALVPAFPIYAMNIQKDTLFSCWVLLSGILAVEVNGQIKGGKLYLPQCIALAILLVLVWFARNNGPFVTLGVVAWLGVTTFRMKNPKAFLCSAVPALAACLLVVGPIFSAISAPTEDAESVGIPLQQVAAAVVYEGDIDSDDMQYLGELLPLESYQNYTPCLADTLKWDAAFNNELLKTSKSEFMQIWLRTGLKNVGTYIRAYVMETYGFWVPGAKNAYGFLDTRVQDNDYGIERIDLFQRITGSDLPSRTATSCTFFGSGTLLWALLLLAAMKIDSRKPRGLLLAWPALLVVLTILIATPVAFSLRYVFVLAIGLPIYCVETFSHAPLEGKEHAEKRASRRPHRRQGA